MYFQSNNWWRFRKILWPSQNIWTLSWHDFTNSQKRLVFVLNLTTIRSDNKLFVNRKFVKPFTELIKNLHLFLQTKSGKPQPDRIRVLLMPLYYSWEKKYKGEKSQVGNENNKQCIKYEARTNDDAMCVNHLLHPKNAIQVVHLTKSRLSFT